MAKPTKTSPAGILRQLDRSINATRKELDGLVAARDAISGVILSNARTPRVTQIHGSRSQMIRTILDNAPGPLNNFLSYLSRHFAPDCQIRIAQPGWRSMRC